MLCWFKSTLINLKQWIRWGGSKFYAAMGKTSARGKEPYRSLVNNSIDVTNAKSETNQHAAHHRGWYCCLPPPNKVLHESFVDLVPCSMLTYWICFRDCLLLSCPILLKQTNDPKQLEEILKSLIFNFSARMRRSRRWSSRRLQRAESSIRRKIFHW